MMEGFSLRSADAIVVTTPADRDFIAERHHLDADRITIVPNPIDIEVFHPDRSPENPYEKTPIEDDDGILTIGRLVPEKNLLSLITAMTSINTATLHIVGSGPEESDLRSMAGSNVKFLGRVSNSDIPDLHRHAQVFVLASRYEGSPKALLEAMACGKAVVGADSPGIREVIEDGVNGLLVPGEAGALAEAINRLLGDKALRSRLGAAARQYVVTANSEAASVALERVLIRRLVGKGRDVNTDQQGDGDGI